VGAGNGTGSVHRGREDAGHFGEPGREGTGTSRGRGHLDAGDLPDSADTAGTGDTGGFGDFGSGVEWV